MSNYDQMIERADFGVRKGRVEGLLFSIGGRSKDSMFLYICVLLA